MPTLNWLNRDSAFQIARNVPYRLLETISEHGASDVPTPKTEASSQSSQSSLALEQEPVHTDQSEASEATTKPAPTHDNLLIHGDNLEALKSLLPFYRGQVKCIFIDPPYNTKSAFEHYDDNLEHAQWLSMMLPRLQLLRELLREDGSIWVTIDDNEGHYLKVLMDEVFGRGKFIATCVWQSRYSRSSDTSISLSHNFVHCYAIEPDKWKRVRNRLQRTAAQEKQFNNPDGDRKGAWRAIPWDAPNIRLNLSYPITTPTGKVRLPPPGRCWSRTEAQWNELVDAGLAYFGKSGDGAPSFKQYLSDSPPIVPNTWWGHEEAGHTDEAKKEAHEIFGAHDVFGTPKPERLLQRIIHIATNPNDLILDSFLGSGTTAAVAQKMGRRWIGIEMGEHAKTHCVPRLQKVIDGEQGGISKAVNWQGGGSFRFMQLGAPVFDETGSIHPEVRFKTLAAFVWMQETGLPWRGAATTVGPERSEGSDGRSAPVRETLRQAQGERKGQTQGERASDAQAERNMQSPHLGTHDGVAYFLLFNGILGDRRPQGGNVLTRAVLSFLTVQFPHAGPRVIYGESVRVGADTLAAASVVFKSIPHEIEAR